jgi:hypothetical protein
MQAFECSRCRKTTYHPSQRMASCCDGSHMEPLVSICYLIPASEEPTFKVVHTSPTNSVVKLSNPGGSWATACNASVLPKVRTAYPQAVTCYKCNQWLERRSKQAQALQELESVESFMKDSKLEDSDEDSIVLELGEVRKELEQPSKINSLEELNAVLTKIENLHKMTKERKLVRNRLQLLQEIKK